MANNFDASVVNTILASRALTKLNGRLGYLPAFTADFSDELRDVRSRSVTVPFISGGSAVQVDPTDFEVGDTYVQGKTVQLFHISKTAYLTPYDLQNGRRIEWLADQSLNTVANEIERRVFSLIQEGTFGTAITYPTLGSMPLSTLQSMWGGIPGDTKNAILADSEYKNFLQSNLQSFQVTGTKSAYGFDYFDHTNNGFAAAGSGIRGFVANPNAIVMAAAIPQYAPSLDDLVDSQIITVPELGLSIQSNIWSSAKTRNVYQSYDLLFGCAVGDTTAMKLAKGLA